MATKEGVPMIGRTLGHYRIVERIAARGMAEVYPAEDTKTNKSEVPDAPLTL